jgi:hypothetical protein
VNYLNTKGKQNMKREKAGNEKNIRKQGQNRKESEI